MKLSDPVAVLARTSPITIKKLLAIEVHTINDLINYVPFRYENYSIISPINRIQEGETITIQGKVIDAKISFTRKGLRILKVKIDDGTGKIDIIWYNQPYLAQYFKPNATVSIAGTLKRFLHTYTFEPKEYELIQNAGDTTLHTGRIVPIYSEKYGLSSRTLREKIYQVLQNIESDQTITSHMEWLPDSIIGFNKLSSEWQAYKDIHFPKNLDDAKKARNRLAFDELFVIKLSAALIKQQWKEETVTHPFDIQGNKKQIDGFIESLPFSLTGAQSRSVNDILTDLAKPSPMNRFLQGDVGSGKTVVAATAAYAAHLNGFQTLIMAPTEILAEQHFKTISSLFKNYPVKIALQTGSTKMVKKDTDFNIIIGTQALITKSLSFDRIGVVVVDEQHRFGVAQRAMLKQKGANPHLLTMTATPIPRTVALTLYGELDLSEINEMPKGRIPIKTFLTPPEKRTSAYEWIRTQMKTTESQVFIICPLIEESEVETMKSIRAATKEYEYLKRDVFKQFNVALLHGKMKAKEKNEIMAEFKDKKYDILVSTSVVEVGIDIPNATIMLIEGADRFGLAQLHQLRGRVGRGAKQSYCLLFTEVRDQFVLNRLNYFAKTPNGMDLAEYDLRLRGPGVIYGTQQHGYMNLKVASLSDISLIRQVKDASTYFMNHHNLDEYPKIKEKIEEYRGLQVSRD